MKNHLLKKIVEPLTTFSDEKIYYRLIRDNNELICPFGTGSHYCSSLCPHFNAVENSICSGGAKKYLVTLTCSNNVIQANAEADDGQGDKK